MMSSEIVGCALVDVVLDVVVFDFAIDADTISVVVSGAADDVVELEVAIVLEVKVELDDIEVYVFELLVVRGRVVVSWYLAMVALVVAAGVAGVSVDAAVVDGTRQV